MNVVAGIFVAMYGMGCYAAGICMAMAFKNEKSYDKGYDDGWADAKRRAVRRVGGVINEKRRSNTHY